jgi:hypothetical protein
MPMPAKAAHHQCVHAHLLRGVHTGLLLHAEGPEQRADQFAAQHVTDQHHGDETEPRPRRSSIPAGASP